MGILIVDGNNINLDDTNYNEDDSKLLFMSDSWLGIVNLKNVYIYIYCVYTYYIVASLKMIEFLHDRR